MLFNSLTFAAFLAVVLPVYHALPRRGQNVFLVGASYLFYGWWDWRFLSLLWVSTAVDYWAANRIAATSDPKKRNFALGVSLVTNLGILGFFKYFNFFVDTANASLEALGVPFNTSLLYIVLPVGISFYTFQTLAYTIDTWRGRQTPTADPVAFALYVAYFPQLVAGPIERAKHLLPQLEQDRVLTPQFLRTGITLILIGLFKKVGLADGVAPFVDEVFGEIGAFSSSSVLCATLLFCIQIYGDFSGYSDIARGTSRLLGIDLMVNFRQPYLAQNIAELWRRWHISLSTWFADYVYIPLGGSKRGPVRNAFNLVGMFALSGLWHGAAWNFVLWATLNGVCLLLFRYWSELPRNEGVEVAPFSLRWFAGNFATLTVFVLTALMFRSDGLAGVWTGYMALLLNPWWLGIEHVYVYATLAYGIPMVALDLWQYRSGEEEPMLASGRVFQGVLLGCAMIWVLVMGGVDLDVPFIYFQF
ncbi:MAG: MBOAT family protein [Alphaproteobacteria bacterium]|nr:MBOAT family protein [Alphaproteobacteria bacterium]